MDSVVVSTALATLSLGLVLLARIARILTKPMLTTELFWSPIELFPLVAELIGNRNAIRHSENYTMVVMFNIIIHSSHLCYWDARFTDTPIENTTSEEIRERGTHSDSLRLSKYHHTTPANHGTLSSAPHQAEPQH